MTQDYNGSSYPYNTEMRNYYSGGGSPQGGQFGGESNYPGLSGNPYGEVVRPGGLPNSSNLPAVNSSNLPAVPGGGQGGLLGNFNIGQLKTVLDRMGGIDGVIGTMSKVQKVMSSLQQMAPMLKLMLGTFGGKAKTKNAGLDLPPPVRRKRRKKRSGSTGPGSGARKRSSGRTRR